MSAVLLIDPKNGYNVGGVLRACAIFGVPTLRWTGERVQDRRSTARFGGTACKKAWRLPREERLRTYDTAVDWCTEEGALDRLVDEGLSPVCVELTPGATPLPIFQHPERAVYVFGPEDGGVPKGIRHVCHHFVQIPASGCLNLAAAVNVVLYDRAMKKGLVGFGLTAVESTYG